MDCSICLVKLLLNLKMQWLKKLQALNLWSLIGLLSIGIAIVLSFTKGFSGEMIFIGVLGLALLFNLFDYYWLKSPTFVGFFVCGMMVKNIFYSLGRLDAPVSCLNNFPSLNLKKDITPWIFPSLLNLTTTWVTPISSFSYKILKFFLTL